MYLGLDLSLPALALRRAGGFSPASLFAAGEQGAWYDPSDLTTLFTDSAGTTPVATPGAGSAITVGLMLDKSKGLVLGSELVTNTGGPFTTTVGWTAQVDATLSINSGSLRVTNDAASTKRAYFSFASVVGRSYVFVASVSGAGGGVVGGRLAAGTTSTNEGLGTTTSTASGSLRLQFVATGTTTFIQLVNQGTTLGGYAEWASASLKELPGNHAYQTDSAKRPALSAKYNLLTYSEQFDNAYWTKTAASVTQNTVTDPLGTTTADSLIEDGTPAAAHFVQTSTVAMAAGASHRLSVAVKAAGRSWVCFQFTGTGVSGTTADRRIWFNVAAGAGAVGTNGSLWSGASITDLGSGWYRCSAAITQTGTGNAFLILAADADNSASYDGNSSTSLYLWGADLRVANESSALPPYQRVVDALTYDTAGFPYYLLFDGIADALVTNSIDFSTGATNPPLGPELVTNGDFSNGTTGWTVGPTSTFSVVDGDNKLKAVSTLADGAYFGQLVPVVAGKFYEIRFTTISDGTSKVARLYAGTFWSGTPITPNAFGSHRVIWQASTTGNVAFWPYGTVGGIGTYILCDNIAIKELTDSNYAPDRMSVFAGVRKLSDVAVGLIAELSANWNTNAGSFVLSAADSAGTYAMASRGTTAVALNQVATATGYAAPTTDILTSTNDISGDLTTLRVDAMPAPSATGDKGTGNYVNQPLYIGSRAGTSAFFNGRLHSLIVLGRTVTPTELTQTEGYVETKTFGKDMQYVLYENILGPDGEQLTLTAGGDDLYVYQNYE